MTPSLFEFTRDNWHRVSNTAFRETDDIKSLCELIEASFQPNARKSYAGICAGKTTVGTIMLPVWAWMQDPTLRIMVVQHNMHYARDVSMRFIGLARELGVPLEGSSSFLFQKNPKGGFRAVSSPWRIPAYRIDLLILDDAFHACHPGQAVELRHNAMHRVMPGGRVLEMSR